MLRQYLSVSMQSWKKRSKRKKGDIALKLDKSKAYDWVEWDFLREIMKKMGFEDHWISLVKRSITTSSFSFLINGEVKGNVVPSRGLCQGCPLSSYLFLLCVEGLSAILKDAAHF